MKHSILAVLLALLTAPAAQAEPSVDCTPIAEIGYDAGTPFSLTVITIDGVTVEEELARAYYQMALAAEEDGVTLELISGFRTMEEQQYLWECYQGAVDGVCPPGCSSCNIAATPGYSKHQKGDAIDVATAGGTNTAYKWLKGLGGYAANGQAFGFQDTFNPPEPWHWVYVNPGPWVGPCDDPGPVEDPTACVAAPVSGAENELFKDLPPGTWGKEEAEALFAAGITNGCAVGIDLFCPDCVATRAQSVTLLLRAAGVEVGGQPATPSFIDLEPGAYYVPYVEKAVELGITNGCSATEFCPDNPTKRKEFAKFVITTLGVPTVNPATPTFTDLAADDWSYPYVEALVDLCITSGCSATEFCPDDSVTRVMAAVFIARAFDLQDANECISYCDASVCADASFCENWGACSFADQCAETGVQTRVCHTYGCAGPITNAACVDAPSNETQGCVRDTDGDVVIDWGSWSACAPDAPCATTGTRSRSRTVCAGGAWTTETEYQACTPPPDPACLEPDPTPDAAPDAGEPDAGEPDAGEPDAGEPDAGEPDAGEPDAGIPDAGEPDAGVPDAAEPDAGAPDGEPDIATDTGPVGPDTEDAGTPDAGIPDASTPDVGIPDTPAPDSIPADIDGPDTASPDDGTATESDTPASSPFDSGASTADPTAGTVRGGASTDGCGVSAPGHLGWALVLAVLALAFVARRRLRSIEG